MGTSHGTIYPSDPSSMFPTRVYFKTLYMKNDDREIVLF